MIVIDASAAVFALLRNGDARAALASESLASPHLVDAEVAHALRGQVIRGAIAADDGELALARWSQLGLERVPIRGLLNRMWELRGNLSAYDASYVATAEAFECTLLTADARLARASGLRCDTQVITS